MMAGFFRFLCANGLIVADSTFEGIRIRHQKLAPQVIEDGIERYLKIVPEITSKTEEMNSLIISPVDQLQLASNIIDVAWGDLEIKPLEAAQLIEYRRPEDKKGTLWNTYNVIQENLFQGGLTGKTQNGRTRKTREITSISKNINLNKVLWEETNKMLLAA